MAQRDIRVNLLFQADTTLAQQNIQQLNGLLHEISNAKIGFNSGGIQQAAQDAKQLQLHLQNALNQNTGKLDLSKLNSSLKSSNTSLSQLTASLQSCGPTGQQAFSKIAMAISQAEAPMYRLSAKTRDLLTTLGNTAKWQIASSAIHGITGAISESIQYIEKFDRALTDIRMVSDLNNDQMLKFVQNTRNIAKEVNATSLEIAQGSTIFFQQGLDTQQVEERIAVTTKMANITGETTEKVSSQLTAIWNNFNKDGTEALESYADTLTYLGAKTAADTNQIATAMEKFAASADTVGLSYEYAASAVAQVIDRTQMAPEEVGTAFKTILSRMQGLELGETLEDGVDLNKYSEALKTIGVDVLDANDNLRDADDILKDLGEKWTTLDSAEKKALATTVAGVRQQTQFIALMEEWGDVEQTVDSLGQSVGFLNEQNDKYAESVAGVKKQFEEAKGQLFQDLFNADTLKGFFKVMTDLVNIVDNIVEAFGGLGPMILVLCGVFAKTLFPTILNGVRNLGANVMQLLGFTNNQIKRIQEEFSKELQLKVDSGELDATTQKQIELSQTLLQTKNRLTEASKHMGEAEKQMVQNQILLYEYAAQNLQKELDKQFALEQQVKLQKELLSSESKKDVGTAVAVNKFKEKAKADGMSQEDQDAIIETATTRSSTEISDEITRLSGPDPDLVAKQQQLEALKTQRSQLGQDEQVYQNQLDMAYDNDDDRKAAYELLEKNRTATADGHFAVAKGGDAEAAQYKELVATKEKIASVDEEILALTKQIEEAESENSGNEEEIRLLEKSLELKKQINTETRNANEQSVVASSSEDYENEGTTERAVGNQIFNAQMKNPENPDAAPIASMITTPGEGEGASIDTLHVESSIENMSILAEKHGELTSRIQTMNNMEKDLGKTLETVNKGLKTNKSETEGSEKATKKKEGALSGLLSKLKKTSKEEDKMAKEMKDATNNAKAFGNQVKKMAKELLGVGDGADELKAINAAMEQLESSDPEVVAKGLEVLQKELKELKAGTQDAANTVDMAAEMMKSDLSAVGLSGVSLDQLENALKQLGLLSEDTRLKLEQLRTGMDNAAPPAGGFAQKMTSITSGMAAFVGQASMALSGIQMLGSAFQEGNTPLETMITLLSGLGMILPVVTTVFKAYTTTSALANKEGVSFGAVIVAKIAGLKLEENATWSNTAAKIANLLSSPWTWALAAIAVAAIAVTVGAIMDDTAATEENTQANLENQQASKELSNTWLEESEAMDGLVMKYKQLKKAGDDYREAAQAIIDQAPELIAAYRDMANSDMFAGNEEGRKQLEAGTEKMENAAAAGDVETVIAAQKENDMIAAEAAHANAEKNANAAKNNLATKLTDTQGSVDDNGKYKVHVGGYNAGFSKDNEEANAVQYLKNNMSDSTLKNAHKDGHGWSSADIELDTNDSVKFLDQYEQLLAAKKDMEANMSAGDLEDSGVYQEVKELIENTKDQYGELKTSVAEMNKYTYVKAAQDMKAEGKDVTDVGSYAEYEQYKEDYMNKMKEELSAKGIKEGSQEYSEAMQEAENWLLAQENLSAYINLEKSLEHVGDKFGEDAKKKVADYYDALSAEERELFENVKLGELESIDQESLDAAMLDAYAESLDMTSEAFEHYVDQVKASNKNLKDNPELARKVAKAQLEVERATKKAGETYKNNKDNLDKAKEGTEEFSTACAEMSGALNDVFGEGTFDAKFVADNLDMVKRAMEGDIAAINQLYDIAGQEILIEAGVDLSDGTIAQEVNDWIGSQQFNDLKVGATLDSTGMTDTFNDMFTNGEIWVDDMNKLLKGVGFEPVIDYKEMPIDEVALGEHNQDQEVEVLVPDESSPGGFKKEKMTLKSAVKTHGGSQAKVMMPYIKGRDTIKTSTPKNFSNGVKSGNPKSGGSGSGSGSSSKPAKKSRSTKKTDIVDRYKETNDQLNKIKDTIEDTSREMDTLWGPKRLEAMDKYGKSLQKQIQTQGKYKQEIVDSLAIDKKAVQDFMNEMPNGEIGGLGDMGLQFTFDEDGYITNYTDVMTSLYTKLTEMEAHKNSLGTEEAQSEYEDSTLGPFRDRVNELKDLVGQYDDTNQLLMDADNEYQEMIIEWQQNNYDQIVYKVELRVEFSELQLEQVEYYLDKIQDDWYSAAESVTLYGDQIVPLTGNIQSYIGMLDELKTKLNNNEINQAQYMEGLKEVQSGLIDNINTLQDALESVGEYYLNTLDQINEKLDIQTSKFDGLTSVLEHYKEITTLINGEKDYKTLNNIVKSQRKLAEDQLAVSERKLTMYENQKAQVQSEIDKAKLLQDDKLRKQTLDKLEQDMAEIDNLIADEQSSIMEHITTLAELAMEELTNTLAEAKKRMEEAILGGEGLSIDSMLSQIERLNTKQEEYLTNTNKLYETNKLIRQAQMDMDKTDNQRAKQHYNDYIKYIEQLQQSGQLTQFELEMAQAEYDVLQKKIALEEAQEAKNQVRLTRDSEGNYGYVYTANQENIDKAEQEFADAQNARYNKALEGAKKYQDQYYQAVADMESALEELEEERANHLITDEEYERRRAEIVDTYLTIAETSYELYFKATGIMMEESSNNLLDYELKGVGNMENLRDATEQYIEDSNKAFTTYDQKIDEVALHSEENFGKVEEGIGDVEEASQDLVLEINNNLIPTMEKELAETLTNSMKQWYALATAIKTAREEAEKAMDVIQKETKLEGGFITDYSDEIAKELEKGEKADYEYINSLLAARDKKMGYLDTYDYSQMMEDYLAGGGKDTDAIYKAYELLREHKMEMWKNIDFDQMLKDHLASNGKIDDEKAKKILEARAQKINVLGVTDAISNEELIKQLTGGNTSATTETTTASEEKKEDSAAAPDLVVGNKVEVKSGTKWYGSSSGTGGTGTAKGGTIKYINEGSNYPYNIDGLGWIKKSDIVGYNTGGYTGDWGPEGKLAILHEKELVLNAQDTENFLGGIAVLREISQMLDNNALIASLGAINLHAMTIGSPADQILQQEVTIHADFPNVTDHNEIEIAIDNLINAASQHAYQV